MEKRKEPKTLADAIEELEKSTHSKSEELKGMLTEDFEELQKKLSELKPHFDSIKQKVEDEAYAAKGKIEGQFKTNPWWTLGIVGLIFFLVGYILAGRSNRD